MPGSPSSILRVQRSDDASSNSFVVVEVKSKSTRTLDVRLVGSDSEAVFVGEIKQSGIAELRSSPSSCSDALWADILEAVLWQKPVAPEKATGFQGVEAVAAVSDGHMTITIRKNVQGITQRLGLITLVQDDVEEVNFIDWAATAASAAEAAASQISSLKSSLKEQQVTIENLNKQLDEFVAAKKNHETELLRNFTELLNSKKRKIRDQQRLLAVAKIDETAAHDATNNSESRRRKAAEIDEDSESDGFEKISTKGKPNRKQEKDADEDMADLRTPERSDDETSIEDDYEAQSTKYHPREDADETLDEGQSIDDVPPVRHLPFARGNVGDKGKKTRHDQQDRQGGAPRLGSDMSDEGLGSGREDTDDEL